LLTILKLGDLQSVFKAPIAYPVSEKKLVDKVSQKTLRKIFSHHLDYSTKTGRYSLKEVHYQVLQKVYDLCVVNDSQQAKTLLSVAILFIKFSAKEIFGNGDNSPEMLRNYAYALMKKAHELDPTIFSSVDEDQFEYRTNWLLGPGKGKRKGVAKPARLCCYT